MGETKQYPVSNDRLSVDATIDLGRTGPGDARPAAGIRGLQALVSFVACRGPRGTTSALSLAFGASAPWKRSGPAARRR